MPMCCLPRMFLPRGLGLATSNRSPDDSDVQTTLGTPWHRACPTLSIKYVLDEWKQPEPGMDELFQNSWLPSLPCPSPLFHRGAWRQRRAVIPISAAAAHARHVRTQKALVPPACRRRRGGEDKFITRGSPWAPGKGLSEFALEDTCTMKPLGTACQVTLETGAQVCVLTGADAGMSQRTTDKPVAEFQPVLSSPLFFWLLESTLVAVKSFVRCSWVSHLNVSGFQEAEYVAYWFQCPLMALGESHERMNAES